MPEPSVPVLYLTTLSPVVSLCPPSSQALLAFLHHLLAVLLLVPNLSQGELVLTFGPSPFFFFFPVADSYPPHSFLVINSTFSEELSLTTVASCFHLFCLL